VQFGTTFPPNRPRHGATPHINEQTFGISLKRILDADELAVHDVFTVQNYDVTEHKLRFCLQFHADFEDIFQIRGLHPKKLGKVKHPEWRDRRLVLSYEGADGITRTLEVHTDPEPDEKGARSAEFHLTLQAGEKCNIRVVLYLKESQQNSSTTKLGTPNFERAENAIVRRTRNWLVGAHRPRAAEPGPGSRFA
jgi:glycogen debranching enzyme